MPQPNLNNLANTRRLDEWSAIPGSNGTKVFAIDIKSYVPIEPHLALFKLCEEAKLDHIKTKTLLLKETLDLLEIDELDFGIHLSYEDVYQQFHNEYEFCHSQVEINER